MISFDLPHSVRQVQAMARAVGTGMLRPMARTYDEKEHEIPWDLMRSLHQMLRSQANTLTEEGTKEPSPGQPKVSLLTTCVAVQELAYGDAGLTASLPGPGVGGAAVQAAGTQEQKERFLRRFAGEEPVWGAFALTEPGCGSDTSAVATTARVEGDEVILNGEKIFVTNGGLALDHSKGFVVVWATLDKSLGRAGIRPFVVEAGTPGIRVTKLEKKMGIRASNTAALVLEDCRVPLSNMLGALPAKGEAGKRTGIMATFDSTRPLVASLALGVGQAAFQFLLEALSEKAIVPTYGKAACRSSRLDDEVLWMERQMKAAKLLTWRAASLYDEGLPNNLEAAMAKAKAGNVVTQVTQKCAELLGPEGYACRHLVEKWFRDAKINDIYEGTGQIQMLIVARRVTGFSRDQLK